MNEIAYWIVKHYYAVGNDPKTEHWRWIKVFKGQEDKFEKYRLPSWIFLISTKKERNANPFI